MNPQKFVRRNTKVILGGVVAIMAVSLVFSYSDISMDDPEGAKTEGVIFGEKEITRADFRHAEIEAEVYHRWTWFHREDFPGMANVIFFLYQQRDVPELREDTTPSLREKTWEYLTLLEEADHQQVVAAPEEATARIDRFIGAYFRGLRRGTPQYARVIGQLFLVEKPSVFERALLPIVRIEKLLDLLAQGNVLPYETLSDTLLREHRQVRARVAGFDPRDFTKFLQPVRPNEIAEYFKANEGRFRIPEKVQAEYVAASWKDFSGRIADITEDDMKAFYEENKTSFPKERPAAAPAAEETSPPQEDYKSFEEVRTEVYDRLVEQRAKKIALGVIRELSSDLGEEMTEVDKKGGSYEEIRLGELLEKFTARGEPLRHGVTASFGQSEADDVQKAEGLGDTNGELANWSFQRRPALYQFSSVLPSDTGYVLLQIRGRQDPYVPDLTRGVEEAIRRELARRQLAARARQEAERLAERIRSLGFSEARRRSSLEFETSRYFSIGDAGPVGLSEAAWDGMLRNQLRGIVVSDPPRIGESIIIDGETVSPQKKYWAFLAYVDDVLPPDGPDIEKDFTSRYVQENATHLQRMKDQAIGEIIALSDRKDFEAKGPGSGSERPE